MLNKLLTFISKASPVLENTLARGLNHLQKLTIFFAEAFDTLATFGTIFSFLLSQLFIQLSKLLLFFAPGLMALYLGYWFNSVTLLVLGTLYLVGVVFVIIDFKGIITHHEIPDQWLWYFPYSWLKDPFLKDSLSSLLQSHNHLKALAKQHRSVLPEHVLKMIQWATVKLLSIRRTINQLHQTLLNKPSNYCELIEIEVKNLVLTYVRSLEVEYQQLVKQVEELLARELQDVNQVESIINVAAVDLPAIDDYSAISPDKKMIATTEEANAPHSSEKNETVSTWEKICQNRHDSGAIIDATELETLASHGESSSVNAYGPIPPIDQLNRNVIEVFLNQCGIVIKNLPEEDSDANLAQIALFIGNNFKSVKNFYDTLKSNLTTGELFTVNLKNQIDAIPKCLTLVRALQSQGFVEKYEYRRTPKYELEVKLNKTPKENFISGLWLEIFVKQQIILLIKRANPKLKYSYLLNPRVILPTDADFEFDLLFEIEGEIFWFEAKTVINSQVIKNYVEKYSNISSLLGLDREHTFVIVTDLSEASTKTLSDKFNLTVVSVEKFSAMFENLVSKYRMQAIANTQERV
jgi:hypothetical protein